MRAIAVHTFAGGFAQGVKAAGFEILKCHEPLGLGVETLRQRMGLRVETEPDVEKWRRPAVPIDLVFGNPRCGGFSGLGSNTAVEGVSRGDGCRQAVDIEQLLHYGCRVVRAGYVVFESVQPLEKSVKNRSFLERMMEEVVFPAKYSVAHVHHNAASFGSCQIRRRYFFVAYRRGETFGVVENDPPATVTTVGDVLETVTTKKRVLNQANISRRDAIYNADTHHVGREDYELLMPYFRQGDSLNHLHRRWGWKFFSAVGCARIAEQSKNPKSDIPFGVASNCPARIKWDAPCPTLVGNSGTSLIHPTRDRYLTVGELSALMGWSFIPAGPYPALQVAKGIVPACGEWIARSVHRSSRSQKVVEADRVEGRESWFEYSNAIGDKGETIFNPARVEPEPLPAGLTRGLFAKKRG